ncbi:helix-turn-helix transcriptional regulator [Ochrobactrum anthropi ATCC 49188]|nr:helix-turn-helix transcriptional regulator [Brucella anthropi ATCC 49188]
MLTLLGAGINGVDREEMQRLPVNLPMRKSVLAYIDDNLFNPLLGPNLIVQNLRVSRSRLYRTFDTEGGIATIIREKRLDHAYRILVGECGRHVSFKEIAYRCGFHDGAQFTRAFKTRFGMSPKEARETKAPCYRQIWATSIIRYILRKKPPNSALSNRNPSTGERRSRKSSHQ